MQFKSNSVMITIVIYATRWDKSDTEKDTF